MPACAHCLIWNSMMSFGGGWFFVAQSEAISVMNKDIKLPGLGSYMAQAIALGDNRAASWAVVAVVLLILASDQLVWRPLLTWADKFKIELTESAAPDTEGRQSRCVGRLPDLRSFSMAHGRAERCGRAHGASCRSR